MKLHGHPQLAEYTDLSKCPSLGVHMNWGPGENPVRSPIGSDGVFDIVALRLGNSALGHMHLNLLNIPLYAELSAPIRVKFSVVVFNADGEAFIDPASQSGIRDIIFDDPDHPGTPLPPGIRPTMRAALGVEKTYTGTLIIDPVDQQLSQFPTLHGWWNPSFSGVFRFDNSDHVDKELLPCFFSMVDPTKAESDGVPFVSARVSPHSDRRHTDFTEEWGQQIIETKRGTVQWLPVRPLKAGEVHRVTIAMAGYGASNNPNLPLAINELRRDSAIHTHGGGIVEQSVAQHGNVELECVFEADKLGPGAHPFIAGRRQAGLLHDDGGVDGNVVQMTFSVPVEGVAPPPMPTTVTVPNVVGMTETAARASLASAMLRTGMVMVSSDASPSGQVFRQVPAVGTIASMDSAVDLDVSSGPAAEPPGEVVGTIEKRTVDGVGRYCICVGDQCIVLP